VGGGSAVAAAAELYVGRLCNHQLERSTEACREVESMLRRESSLRVLVPLTDQLLVAITNQLQLLHKASHETHDLQHMSTNYTLLITILRMASCHLLVNILFVYLPFFHVPDFRNAWHGLPCFTVGNTRFNEFASVNVSRTKVRALPYGGTNHSAYQFTGGTHHWEFWTHKTCQVSIKQLLFETRKYFLIFQTLFCSAQLRMLYECIATPSTHPKFTELVMKSLWKVMRIIQTWGDTLDFAAVLREVNHFLAVSVHLNHMYRIFQLKIEYATFLTFTCMAYSETNNAWDFKYTYI
jgi:hypothetical protein